MRQPAEAGITPASGFRGSFAEFSEFLRTDPRFVYDRPEDLVAGYRDIAKRIDPGLVRLFGRLPRLPYGVKPLEGDGAKSAPVFQQPARQKRRDRSGSSGAASAGPRR